MAEKELFLGQFFEMEILINLPVLSSPKTENRIFIDW